MKTRKLIRDSFYVNNVDISNVIINGLNHDLWCYYNDNWMLSILDNNGNVIQTTGLTSPLLSIDNAIKNFSNNKYLLTKSNKYLIIKK